MEERKGGRTERGMKGLFSETNKKHRERVLSALCTEVKHNNAH